VPPDAADDADGEADTTADATDAGPPAPDVEPGSVVDPAFEPPGDLSLPDWLVPGDGEFMVVVLPDTQIYAERFPATFDSQIRWIVDHADAYNIVFVSHVGDIVQTASAANEWQVARAAFDWLDDIDMPHGFSVAGHDVSSGRFGFEHDASCTTFTNLDCQATAFRENFGPQHYEDRTWYGGASPSEISSYQRVSAEGMDLLFLHLPQDPPRAEVEWAKEVLDANPGVLAHLTTHRYLFDYRLTEVMPRPLNILPSGRFNAATYTLGGQSLKYRTSLSADQLFEEVVEAHPNVWSVHCGHVDAEFRQRSTNAAGLPVYEILADFQDMADGGGGWLRVFVYRPGLDRVDVATFSTVTGELRANGDGLDHSIDILESYAHEAASFLRPFGLDEAEVARLLAELRSPTELRETYRASLYDAGRRDSRFWLPVDFDAYIDASR